MKSLCPGRERLGLEIKPLPLTLEASIDLPGLGAVPVKDFF
jgi:hypothetical protein